MSSNRFRLAVFDMDGVLTSTPSSWEFVHRQLGVDNMKNLDLFKKGRITYMDFLKSDVLLWLDKMGTVRADEIKGILDGVPLRNGIAETIASLNGMGMHTAIVSGGIYWLAERIGNLGGFSEIHANKIRTNENGEIMADGTVMVDPRHKDRILMGIQSRLGVSESETFSVGDTMQDVALFRHSGFSIAFNPHEHSMVKNASVSLEGDDLGLILKEIERQ